MLPTFLLLASSSEELEDSSALEGIVSKSSVSMERRRRWVQPEGNQYTWLTIKNVLINKGDINMHLGRWWRSGKVMLLCSQIIGDIIVKAWWFCFQELNLKPNFSHSGWLESPYESQPAQGRLSLPILLTLIMTLAYDWSSTYSACIY